MGLLRMVIILASNLDSVLLLMVQRYAMIFLMMFVVPHPLPHLDEGSKLSLSHTAVSPWLRPCYVTGLVIFSFLLVVSCTLESVD